MKPRTMKLNAHRVLHYYLPEDVDRMLGELKAQASPPAAAVRDATPPQWAEVYEDHAKRPAQAQPAAAVPLPESQVQLHLLRARAFLPGSYVAVPLNALREVIRISDRKHPAWDAVKRAMGLKP